MTNLKTQYMGLSLNSPIVVSASPLSEDISNIMRMEDYGAGAVVLHSLFEEQIRRESEKFDLLLQATSYHSPEASDYFPSLDEYHTGTTEYLELIAKAKKRTRIPIIGSLNGITPEGWIDYARQMEQAGADAVEINIFFIPADMQLSAATVEHRYLNIITEVRNSVKIPIAVKMNPYFSAMGSMATRMEAAGANGLVLFNRFYQPDFDINELKLVSNLQYSESNEIRLPLLWIALLYGKTKASLAATTGVQSADEVIKYILAGADIAMTASALYKNGIEYLQKMHEGVSAWMQRMGYKNLSEFRGLLSQQHVADPTAYERANYIRMIRKG